MSGEQRIYWDSFGLQSLYAGVGRHAFELHASMVSQGPSPQIIPSHPHIHAVWHPYFAPLAQTKVSWMRLKPLSLWLCAQQLGKLAARNSNSILLHGLSNYNIPTARSSRLKHVKRVLTVHDLIPLLMPDQVSRSLQVFLRWQMPKAIDAADAIICVSRWTQESLEEFFPAARGKTFMIPNGLKPGPAVDTQSPNQAEAKLLTVARDESYKRLDLIHSVLELLPANITWDLLTDQAGETRLGRLDRRLKVHTNLSASALENLHRESLALVHPSLLEGYCLPAAQSIQMGKPVIYTSGSGIDETVGLAGIGLPATAGAKAWADQINLALRNRSDWLQRCQTQLASIPSWDEVAARTLKVYAILDENLVEAVREQNS